MTATPTQDRLIRFDDTVPETKLVAILRQEPVELTEACQLEFEKGYDDLDYLVFALLSLPSERRIALVRHQNASSSGTEVYLHPQEPNMVSTLVEGIKFLNLSAKDLTWITPNCKEELKNQIAFLGS